MVTAKFKKSESKLKIVLVMLFFILTSAFLTFSLPVFVIQCLLSIITIPLVMTKDKKLARIYVVIFVVSIMYIFLVYLANQLYYGNPYYIGGSDDLKFENLGMEVYHSNLYNPSELMESGVIGQYNNASFFAVYISLLISFSNLFGEYSTFLPRILNAHFLIWICFVLEYLLKKYAAFTDKKLYITLAMFALTPNIQFINSHVFRDTFNLLQVLLIVYLFDKLLMNKLYIRKIIYIVLLFFLVYITYYTRQNSIVFAAVICSLILGERFGIKKRFIAVIIVPIIMLSDFLVFIKLDYFIDYYSEYVLNGVGEGLSGFVFKQPLLPFGIILRSLFAFIIPFPNFFILFKDPDGLLFDLITFLIYLGVLIQIITIPFILKRLLKFDWLSSVFLICFLAIVSTTFTFRHVLFYYPFMVALGIDGYMLSTKRNRKIILFFSGFIGFALALIYISLKLLL